MWQVVGLCNGYKEAIALLLYLYYSSHTVYNISLESFPRLHLVPVEAWFHNEDSQTNLLPRHLKQKPLVTEKFLALTLQIFNCFLVLCYWAK